MSEVTFQVSLDIPTTPRTKYYFRAYLKQIREQLEGAPFGNEGQDVGIGFTWDTHTALSDGGINTISRRMQRALRTSGILSHRANVYFLKQKINYIRDGDPCAVFTIKEEK